MSNNNQIEKTDYGLIQPRSITNEMTESYLDYAMSVIVARALPDVRDGLKPVQRRILYAMQEIGLTAQAKHRKSAKINGEVTGSYHPHGEVAVYDAMVRLAQWWSMRLMLVDGQGNFGSMDGDAPAAYRYTEARLTKAAEALLTDIDRDTVEWRDNYDATKKEPVVLPTRLPNLLINGSTGIAVGMATNVPPHNPGEVIDGLIVLQENPDTAIEDLVKVIKGPDFPTGGIIYNLNDIKEAFATGRGRVIVRGRAEIIEDKRSHILITELPYQTNKAAFIAHLAELVKVKRIEGISDIRDESDRQFAVRVIIELKSGAPASKILNQLYDLTELQTVIHYNLVALVDGLQPRLLNILEILSQFLDHRREVVTRRTKFELKGAQERVHILEGLKIALDHLDAIIGLIRQAKDREAAKVNLISRFKLTEIQANAILDLRLSQLANLERQKVYDEYEAIVKLIVDLEDIIARPERVKQIIKRELLEAKKQFADPRRTEIRPEPLGRFAASDLIPDEQVLVGLTAGNYVKRLTTDTYKKQLRGGKGVIGLPSREDDFVQTLISASTHDDILFFTDRGRVFKTKAYEVPAAARQAKGTALPNLIRISGDEKVTAILASSAKSPGKYLFFATKKGLVKRVTKDAFANVRRSGVAAINLRGDDQLLWVNWTSGADEIAQITKQGQVIVYAETEVRSMGRSASGVRGIRLKAGDEVIETQPLAADSASIIVISKRGIGKRVAVKAFKNQHRGGSGIRIARLNERTGELAAAAVANAKSGDLIIATTDGQIIRITLQAVKQLSRQASGVILIRQATTDEVSSLVIVEREEVVNDK